MIFNISRSEDLKKMPLKDRFILSLMKARASYYFEDAIVDILVEKEDDSVNLYVPERDTAWDVWYAIRQLHDSEYGEMTKDEANKIDELAKEIAEETLIRNGWKGKLE